MDHLSKLKAQFQWRFFISIGLLSLVVVNLAVWLTLRQDIDNPYITAAIVSLIALLLTIVLGNWLSSVSMRPIKTIRQAIVHVYPEGEGAAAPDLESVRLGRELITTLATQVYQLASQEASKDIVAYRRQMSQSANIVSHMPLPLFVFNKSQLVTFTSDAALDYIGEESSKVYGKPLFESLNLEFSTDKTLDSWIKDCQKNKVVDAATWNHVRVKLPDGKVRQCDISAYYNRDNPSGIEFIIALFDKTEYYDRDDNAVGFVALAVHELRMPLTVMRGYIEVFEEELGDALTDDLKDFMHKMKISAEQLAVFINNILNVARIDNNQLALNLTKESWPEILTHIVEDNKLKAQVHRVDIELQIDDKIPPVAVDKISIYEVVSNLIDNAIKYSQEGQTIKVKTSAAKDGMIKTTVEDHGVGIPSNIMGHLFEKFARSHRTRNQVSGSGLGLYLCKAIVNAHGGQVWAKSKEGEGSTFGFSLQPFSAVSGELSNKKSDITRNVHGWIKNHSLYRR